MIVVYHVVKQAVSTDLYGKIHMKLKRRFHSVTDPNDQQAQLLSHLVDDTQEAALITTVISIHST